MKIRQAIVLAGGLGTRLRDVLPDLPKCLAPVAGLPFLSYLINYFQEEGIESFIFCLGYKHELIQQYLAENHNRVSYSISVEQKPLGTGGAIYKACHQTEEKTVLVLNGDTLFKVRLQKLIPFHHMTGAHCTLSLKPMKKFDRYGTVILEKDYRISGFIEKQYSEAGNINGGVYALNSGKFRQLNFPEVFSFEKDYLEEYVADQNIYGVVQDEYFIDIGIPEDYQRAQNELPD